MNAIGHNTATISAGVIAVALSTFGTFATAASHATQIFETTVESSLTLPEMNATNGRFLFGSKACVVCRSVNGIGGEDAPMLDAEFMNQPMNPFDFAARMWRGAEVMVIMQREELGNVIEISGQELADITAFVHDREEQARFSITDVPEDIQELMDHLKAEELGVPHD